ncbi:uncharacterized protein LOC129765096 [Toxorhynchites rutilus septentrionalis]|uniref:uncharacterized protein LOC129765096 n=1 Tax=Toxorhynchites rutilus septentrionalis TaxID=329112 RepID=UPI00247AEF25|nr:uncharacterized protein LOC129765096 [Toxorhynchites rutilus septentrionalis]
MLIDNRKHLFEMSSSMYPFSKEKLIDLVEEMPELWRINLKSNRDNCAKQRMWEEIASNFSDLGITGGAYCAKIWKNIFDCWIKEHVYWRTHKSGAGQKTKRKWCWYERVSFLQKCGKNFGPTESNLNYSDESNSIIGTSRSSDSNFQNVYMGDTGMEHLEEHLEYEE